MKNMKKGAMFGLDARIALAIFGALSVITGAALYSAIQDSRVVSIITEMDNVDKAITAYYLDTGVYPAASALNANLLETRELTDSSVVGWLGPYLTFENGTTDDMLNHPIYDEVAIYSNDDGAWSDGADAGSKCKGPDHASTSTACSVYICYTGIANDIQTALDVKIDGADDNDAGNFRYTNGGAACKKGLLYDIALGAAA